MKRLICWLFGHKRGKRDVSPVHEVLTDEQRKQVYAGYKFFRCPRCSATWTRKVKSKIKVEA